MSKTLTQKDVSSLPPLVLKLYLWKVEQGDGTSWICCAVNYSMQQAIDMLVTDSTPANQEELRNQLDYSIPLIVEPVPCQFKIVDVRSNG